MEKDERCSSFFVRLFALVIKKGEISDGKSVSHTFAEPTMGL